MCSSDLNTIVCWLGRFDVNGYEHDVKLLKRFGGVKEAAAKLLEQKLKTKTTVKISAVGGGRAGLFGDVMVDEAAVLLTGSTAITSGVTRARLGQATLHFLEDTVTDAIVEGVQKAGVVALAGAFTFLGFEAAPIIVGANLALAG